MHDNKGCTTCFPPKMLSDTQPNIYHTLYIKIIDLVQEQHFFFGPEEKKCFQNLASSLARFTIHSTPPTEWIATLG